MSFQAQVQYMVSWILRIPSEKLVLSTDFRKDLKLDCYDFEMLIFQLESSFKHQFSIEEIEQIRTMRDLNRLLEKKESTNFISADAHALA